jgi:hypothetical protein
MLPGNVGQNRDRKLNSPNPVLIKRVGSHFDDRVFARFIRGLAQKFLEPEARKSREFRVVHPFPFANFKIDGRSHCDFCSVFLQYFGNHLASRRFSVCPRHSDHFQFAGRKTKPNIRQDRLEKVIDVFGRLGNKFFHVAFLF